MLSEFDIALSLLFLSTFLGVRLSLFSFFSVPKQSYGDKIEAYECGFDPFEDTRRQFDIRFYIIALLFIIFDLEIVFLFPWCLSLAQQELDSWITMFIFIVWLVLGFIYEWYSKSLDWE